MGEQSSAEPGTAPQPAEGAPSLDEKLGQLERLVRSASAGTLKVEQAQRDAQATLSAILGRLDDMEMAVKGAAQSVARAGLESAAQVQNVEQHYAGALRDLEARIRDEMKIQLYRAALQGILPALDDLDLVIGSQQRMSAEPDAFLEAVSQVRQRLRDGLAAVFGLHEIEVEEGATPFDNTVHSIAQVDIPDVLIGGDDLPSGTIIRVRRAGFVIDGRVLRRPEVFVKK